MATPPDVCDGKYDGRVHHTRGRFPTGPLCMHARNPARRVTRPRNNNRACYLSSHFPSSLPTAAATTHTTGPDRPSTSYVSARAIGEVNSLHTTVVIYCVRRRRYRVIVLCRPVGFTKLSPSRDFRLATQKRGAFFFCVVPDEHISFLCSPFRSFRPLRAFISSPDEHVRNRRQKP